MEDDAPREKTFLLARHEAKLLDRIARRLPARVTPDHMTALGVAAALGIRAAYWLTARDPAWLWVASGLLVVHWLGDSLDGTLARVRRIERPRYRRAHARRARRARRAQPAPPRRARASGRGSVLTEHCVRHSPPVRSSAPDRQPERAFSSA